MVDEVGNNNDSNSGGAAADADNKRKQESSAGDDADTLTTGAAEKKAKLTSNGNHKEVGTAKQAVGRGKSSNSNNNNSLQATILDSLPSEYNAMLGQIGFAPWRNYKLPVPVLIVNPFNAPRPVREQWLEIYHKKKEKDALHQLSYLVYWYGATEEDTRMYGFVTPRTFIPYDVEKAKPKSACNLPERIQSKIGSSEGGTAVDATTTAASNPPLNAKDTITLRAYREVQEDLLKEPSERKRGLYRNANDDDDNNDHDEKAPRRRKKGIPAVDPNDVRAVKSHQRRQSK